MTHEVFVFSWPLTADAKALQALIREEAADNGWELTETHHRDRRYSRFVRSRPLEPISVPIRRQMFALGFIAHRRKISQSNAA